MKIWHTLVTSVNLYLPQKLVYNNIRKENMARVQHVKNVEKCSSRIANWLGIRQAVIHEKHHLLTHIVFKHFFPITSTTWM